MSTSKIDAYFADYASHHKHPMNKRTHYVGIPLILLSLLGMLAQVQLLDLGQEFLRFDLGVVLWGAATLWYLTLDWRIALPFSAFAAGVYWISLLIPFQVHAAAFVIGWIFQGIGHAKYEKTRPAFLDNVLHLLIGPLWIFARAVGYIKK